jgi:hypothetical protein
MAQASRQIQPSDDFIKMSRRIPFMDNEQLASLTSSPNYGALALTEVSKRNRMALMDAAKKQAMAAGQGGKTIADKELAALAQQQMQEKLAADERMGLNNIVAQAEQGALEFGEPVGAAGGGMIAFDRGGEVPGFAAGAFIPLAARALSMYGPRILPKLGMEAGKRGIGALKAHPYVTAGVGTAAGIPFGLDAIGNDEEGLSPEELQKQYEAQDIQEGRPKVDRDVTRGAGRGEGSGAGGRAGRAGISSLDLDTDPRESLRKRRELEKEAGLGEFGSKAREAREKRKQKIEETYGKTRESEIYAAGAEALGRSKPTGRRGLAGLLDVAAPALTGMAKAATQIDRQKAEALDRLAEGEERLALAEEQYQRGDIKDAATRAEQAKKDIFTSNLQLRQLEALENHRKAQLAAAKGRGFRYPTAEMAQLQREAAEINADLSIGRITPKQFQARMANLEQRRRQALQMSMLGGIEIGTRGSDED